MHLREWLARLLREPVVHFLLIGALIFAVDAMRDTPVDVAERTIVVTAKDVERLALTWERMWQRPPTPSELDGIIRDHIKEEVYYREALRLGLDRDDPIVRRRLRQKMEAIALASADSFQPSDAELKALLAKEPSRYASEPRISFEQVYAGAGDAVSLVKRLRAGEKPRGVPISLPGSVHDASESDVARDFGGDFASELLKLPLGEWAGPIASGFGLHAVRVTSRAPAARARFADVRQRLETDWKSNERSRLEAAAYQTLLDGYTIRIARP